MNGYSSSISDMTSNSSTSSEWVKYGLLVTKRIYIGKNRTGERIVILTLIFLDRDGTQFELKSINQDKKVFCVYKKVQEMMTYKIIGRGLLRTFKNHKYTTSEYYTSIKSWWVNEADDMSLNKIPYKALDLGDAIKYYTKKDKAVNIIGTYQGYTKGPDTRYINGKPLVVGYYVMLSDCSGKMFRVLVWHTIKQDKNFCLFNAKKGNDILILNVRSSYLTKDQPRIYTLTSLCQPVVGGLMDLCRI